MKRHAGVRSLNRVALMTATALMLLPARPWAQVKGPLTPGKAAGPPPISRPVQPEGASGILERIEGDVLILRTPQGRKVDVMLASTTKYYLGDRVVVAESLKQGDFVKVLLKPDARGVFFAESVTVETPKEEQPVLLKRPGRSLSTKRSADTPDDSGRPILRRAPPSEPEEQSPGEPAPSEGEKTPAQEEKQPETAPEQPRGGSAGETAPEKQDDTGRASAIPDDAATSPAALIDRARKQAFAYAAQLPNFICREVMTRTVRPGRGGWQTLDVVEADLVYEDGKENYRNIRVGGKPQSGGMAALEGSSSTGEFASTTLTLFHPQTSADFHFVRAAELEGRAASVFDFRVDGAHSRWNVNADGNSITPAHQGSVWIANDSARVLRLEMQAVELTAEVPLDMVEMTVDYEDVRIGGQEYLLPVASENLACWRGTNECSHNKIEFRNYRKFGAESVIVATGSDVSFGTDEAPEK